MSLPESPPPQQESSRRLAWWKRVGLVFVPVVLAVVAWGGPSRYSAELGQLLSGSPVAVSHPAPDGAKLFQLHCAYCHGERGEGNGIASLSIKARYFGAEPYKFTTTTGTRIPTDGCLTATLKRGIAGSSMPSFAQLSEEELEALIGHVRTLTRRGLYDQLVRKSQKEYDDGGDEVDPVKLSAKADDLVKVGAPMALPASFKPHSLQSVEAGRKVFLGSCASCHGPEGLGNGPQVKDLKNDNGTPAVPRNLTSGVFKGGREKENLYARIMLGIPGTPMPAGTTLKPEEVDDLLNYVLSMSGQ